MVVSSITSVAVGAENVPEVIIFICLQSNVTMFWYLSLSQINYISKSRFSPSQ